MSNAYFSYTEVNSYDEAENKEVSALNASSVQDGFSSWAHGEPAVHCSFKAFHWRFMIRIYGVFDSPLLQKGFYSAGDKPHQVFAEVFQILSFIYRLPNKPASAGIYETLTCADLENRCCDYHLCQL